MPKPFVEHSYRNNDGFYIGDRVEAHTVSGVYYGYVDGFNENAVIVRLDDTRPSFSTYVCVMSDKLTRIEDAN